MGVGIRRNGGVARAGAIGVSLLTLTGAAAAQNANVPLDTVTVENQQSQNQLRTEGQDTYTSNVTSVGSKSVLNIRQIPQSISIVTRQRLDDQNLTQLDEAMRQTVGMMVLQNDAGRSSIFSRGYEVDVLVNGMYAPNSSIMGTQPDLFMFDRIEVLKGPNGLLNGATAGNNAGPGATINLIRKSALDRFQMLANVSYGSYNNLRTELDLTGPLNEAKTVRARVVGVFNKRNNFTDYNDNQVFVGYGTIDFDFTENTTLSLSAWRQERDILPFNGLPWYQVPGNPAYPTGAPRNTFIGATWNRFDNRSDDYLAELTHKLQNGGHWKTAIRYSDRFVEYKYAQASTAVNPATGNFNMSLTAAQWRERHLSADSHISTPFTLFGQTHNFTFGVDYKQHTLSQLLPNSTAVPGVYNFNTFNPGGVTEPVTTWTGAGSNTQDPRQFGTYAQFRLKPVEPITLVLGGRLAWYEAQTRNLAGVVTSSVEVDAKFVPYAGIIVDLTRNISAFASYSSIFAPQTERQVSGNTIDPRVGDQYEAGLKGTFFDGRLNATASVFLIKDTNRAFADPLNPGFFINAGEVEIGGFEFEVGGKITPEWELYGGYTNMRTKFITGGTGDFRTFQPRHIFSSWSKYTFLDGPFRNFHLGSGLRFVSSFYSGAGNNRVSEDGYVVADLQVGYKFNQNTSATFTVTNLLDETYYTRVGSTSLFNFYGEPRAYQFKLSTKW